MNIIKKFGILIFTLIANFFITNNVSALDYYTITIDDKDIVTVTKTSGETKENITLDTADPYTLSGVFSYNTETDLFTIDEGIRINSLTSASQLTITTDDKEVFINNIYTTGNAFIEFEDAYVSYDENIKGNNDEYLIGAVSINSSTIDVPQIMLLTNGDLFVDNSTINFSDINVRKGIIKLSKASVNTNSLGVNNSSGILHPTEDTTTWKDINKYIFNSGYNPNGYYDMIFLDSTITLIGEKGAELSAYDGIYIDNTTITDETSFTQGGYNSIRIIGPMANGTTELNIKNSILKLNRNAKLYRNVNANISDSKITLDGSISLQGGNLSVNDSELSSKETIENSDSTKNESPITVNGDINLKSSRVIADASRANGNIVAIAYSGSFNNDDSLIILDANDIEIEKDIDISGIKYNTFQFEENQKIYTLGIKNFDDTKVPASYVKVGEGVDITISITNGTWEDGTSTPKTIKKVVGDVLTEQDLPKGMKSNDGSTQGKWNKNVPITITNDLSLTYTFDIANPETGDNAKIYITLILISLISIGAVILFKRKIDVR